MRETSKPGRSGVPHTPSADVPDNPSSALSPQLSISYLPIDQLIPYTRNARTHSRRQIRQIATSIERFGFTNPVLITDENEIIAGHGRVRAAELIGMAEVPTVQLSHLSEAERRAYVLADNRLALNAGWDEEILAIELQGLLEMDFDLELTGFDLAEIDMALDYAKALEGGISSDAGADGTAGPDEADEVIEPEEIAVSRLGDLWLLGQHRLLCGDAQSIEDIKRLVESDDLPIDLIFTDPPYNVAIDGNVCGKGSVTHREFAFASGEMNRHEFTSFLNTTLSNAASVAKDGAIAFICMDWRHMREMLQAGDAAFTELKNLCVWNKTNGGMGTFYRSKHELIFVYKKGAAPHTNSFGLGETGRYRTNVWDYPGISSLGAARDEELKMHPTVKPVAMIEDAIRDCSRRRETVLDVFGGSGSTLIAAERSGRRARLLEYDPHYTDVIIRRWEKLTGETARLETTGETFEELRGRREREAEPSSRNMQPSPLNRSSPRRHRHE